MTTEATAASATAPTPQVHREERQDCEGFGELGELGEFGDSGGVDMAPKLARYSRAMRRSGHLAMIRLARLVLAGACLVLAGCGGDPLEDIRAQQAAGNWAASIEPLRQQLAEDPDDIEANYLYGVALIRTGQPSLAEWSLRKAMTNDEWRVPAAMQLAGAAIVALDYPAAIEAVNVLLEAEPENVEALVLRANAYAHSRLDNAKALADAERALALDPHHINAFEPKILALIALERIEEAGAAIDEMGERIANAESPSDRQAWHCATAAIFADESGEHALAERRWSDCLERFPAEPNVVGAAVEFYDGRREGQRSLEILRTALASTSEVPLFRSALAARLRAAGEIEAAEALLREGTETDDPQQRIGFWLELAGHYQALEDYDAALEAIEHAVELAEELGPLWTQLQLDYADALLFAGHLDRALEVADTIAPVGHREMIRARVAQERGEPAKALEHFDEAFRLWPNNPWARHSAALAAEALGDFDRAIEEYRYAIRIDPGATDARTRVGHYLVAEGRALEALQLLRVKVDVAPLGLEGDLLSLRAMGLSGNQSARDSLLAEYRKERPALLGRAVAAAAEGARERAGADAALAVLRGQPGLNFLDPRQAEALRALVELTHEAGKLVEAETIVESALAAHPEVSTLHSINARVLELTGASNDQVEAAYARALELDANDAHALAGLGRLARERDPAEAATFFERASQADPDASDYVVALAESLVASGDVAAAEEGLANYLSEHPYDSNVAMRIVSLQLDRAAITNQTLELAQRSLRFGGGAEAQALVDRVQARLGEPGGEK